MGFDEVYAIVDDDYAIPQHLGELPVGCDLAVEEIRRRVIDAHRTLMALNEENAAVFHDLVAALEAEETAALNAAAPDRLPGRGRIAG